MINQQEAKADNANKAEYPAAEEHCSLRKNNVRRGEAFGVYIERVMLVILSGSGNMIKYKKCSG